MTCRAALMLVLVAITLGVVAHAAAESPAGPRGIFVLSEGSRPLPDAVVTSDVVTGLSLRAAWEDVERQPGAYTWPFDAEIRRAAAAGKTVMLRISAARPPAWLYEAGAARFEFEDPSRYRKTGGERRTIPVPWDTVFLEKWTRFVDAFGRRYDGEGHVVLVHVAGPGMTGAEMHLPRTPADREHWKRIGYSKERLVAAWRTVMDAYAKAFPGKPLALNVALPVYEDGVVEAVLTDARAQLGRRLCVQHNGLSAKTTTASPQHRWVVASRGHATIGFQLLSAVTPQGRFNAEGARFGGTMAEGLAVGLDAGASYFEIYAADLADETSLRALRDASRRLAPAGQGSR